MVAKVLSAKQKDELAALLELPKPTKKQRVRLEALAPGACVTCKQAPKESEVKDG